MATTRRCQPILHFYNLHDDNAEALLNLSSFFGPHIYVEARYLCLPLVQERRTASFLLFVLYIEEEGDLYEMYCYTRGLARLKDETVNY